MRCFKIPFTHLDLFLVACTLNFNDITPEYIFQFEDHFQLVFLDRIPESDQEKIEKFIGGMWAQSLTMSKHPRPILSYDSRTKRNGRD